MSSCPPCSTHIFFFTVTATTEIYTLSLHDALPILGGGFGIRGELYPEDVLVCVAAMRLGRPVKWIEDRRDRKSTRLNSSHVEISYAVFCLKKKKLSLRML